MTEISKIGSGCDDDCERGERGERGKRGKRGERGKRGRDGHAGPTTRQIFTASGMYVPTPGTRKVSVRECGGGGAGGGSLTGPGNSVGGGGAAGAALEFLVDGPITGGPVVIGAGGVGVIGAAGTNGGVTSVTINGIVYTAAPGGGGQVEVSDSSTIPAFAQGGITQAGSSAVDIVSGDNGMLGAVVDDPGFNGVGGNGGSGEFGIGGEGTVGGGNGLPGSGRGAGGGGAASPALAPSQVGGNGAPGVVIIDEFA